MGMWPHTEMRKVVTVLFSDITHSVALAEKLDPESLRNLMRRYFEGMQRVLRRHGGSVEKFIGDAIMAVFGVPRVHEDDALRAVRAAIDMRRTLLELNDEFERLWQIRLETRTGINTGEVMTGDARRAEFLVTGDPVNVAARLQQRAEPGQILIGDSTYRLVRDAVRAVRVGALPLRGRAEPTAAWTLLDVLPGAPGWSRRLDSPLVNRDSELDQLRAAFAHTTTGNQCRLVTPMGAAGIGKSRLNAEFLAGLTPHATVISGRCLPYGDGITFWPVAEVVRDAAGIGEADTLTEAQEKVFALLAGAADAALVTERLAPLLGLVTGTPRIQETFWAVRKLFELLAERRPLVAVFDDIHWGEATFLDLLDYLTDWIRDAPILIVCLARPELLDVRAGWTVGRPNASVIPMAPLTPSVTDELIDNLLQGAELASTARHRIAALAEGNPLFVEETLRMLIDDGVLQRSAGGWTATGDLSDVAIPPTIHALLAARLQRLDQAERAVIERASIVGRVFWWEEVEALVPEALRADLMFCLQSLIRKELIKPEFSVTGASDIYRFAHILVRDTVYRETPKAIRAQLHERFASWLELKMSDLAGEYEEILGYHLEQACRLQFELTPGRTSLSVLRRRAALPLASAGLRAFARGDMPAAAKLLSRAVALLPRGAPERLELLPQRAFALLESGDLGGLQVAVAELDSEATAAGDPRMLAHALVLGSWIRLFTNPEGWADDARQQGRLAITTFQRFGDHRGLTKSWSLLGLVHMMTGRFEAAEQAWERAAGHARAAGDHRDELESLCWLALIAWANPTPVPRALRRCREVVERGGEDKKVVASALMAQAVLLAATDRTDQARAFIARAGALLDEVALTVWRAGPLAQLAGWVELLAGDAACAEQELRRGRATLGEIGEMAWMSTVVGLLAEAVYVQGRHDEADELATICERAADAADAYSQVLWQGVRAKVLARRGESEAAQRHARASTEHAAATDFLILHWHAQMNCAEVFEVLGQPEEARAALRRAGAAAERKGHRVGVRRARDGLERLGEHAGRTVGVQAGVAPEPVGDDEHPE